MPPDSDRALSPAPGEPARLMADALPNPIWVAGPDGRFEYLNAAGRDFLGVRLEDLPAWAWTSVVHPDDLSTAAGRWADAVRDGHEYEAEYRLRRHDGEYRWHLSRARPLRGHDGRVLRWFGMCTDIDDQKRAEDAVRASEARFRAMIEKSYDGVELLAADGTILYATPAVSRTGGRTPAEVVGRHAFEWSHPDDAAGIAAGWQRLVASPGMSVTGESRYRHADGSWRWVEATSTNLLADPAVRAVVVNFHDVTARRAAEADVRRSAELLRAVVDETTDAVFVKDRDGKYLLFNAAAARLVGRPVEEVVGRDDTALFDPAGARLVMDRDRRVMATGRAETEVEVLTADGVTRTYLATKAPFRDADGRVAGVVGISRDITGQKRAGEVAG